MPEIVKQIQSVLPEFEGTVRERNAKKNAAKNGGAVKFSAREEIRKMDIPWDPNENSSIKEQVNRVIVDLNKKDPVYSLNYDKRTDDYKEKLDDILRTRFNYKIKRLDGIAFLFDKNAATILGHLLVLMQRLQQLRLRMF